MPVVLNERVSIPTRTKYSTGAEYFQFGQRISIDGATIPTAVSKILNKYGATMLLPGVSGGPRFGYQPGNYRESTGQTLAAADQQVGLVVDANGKAGVELVTVQTVSFNGSEAAFFAKGFTIPQDSLPLGKLYEMTFSYNVSSGSIRLRIGDTIDTALTGTGSRTIRGLALVAGRCSAQNTVTSTVGSVTASVREISGSHAYQSTSGFQPVLGNTGGIQSWQFDSTDDRLQLSSVPFQVADNPFCFVAFESGSTGANRSLVDLATSASSARFANLRISSTGQVQSVVVNDAAVATIIAGETISAGALRVLHTETVSGTQVLYSDGVLQNQAVLSGSFSPTESWIGARRGTSENSNAKIHGVVAGKGAISAGERREMVKFMAQLQGRQL